MAVAAYVTTKARLKLYEYLSEMGASVLYGCNDPVVFLQKDNNPPKVKTGDYLRDLTNELEEYGSGSFIQEFVSGGPKNCAFSVFCPRTGKRATKSKMKGIYIEL